MYWLNADWLLANWVPLAVFALLGFLIAWLVAAMPASRAAGAAQNQVTALESKARKTDSELAALKKEADPLKQAVAVAQAERDDALARVATLEAAATAAEQEKADLEVALEQEQSLLQEQADEAANRADAVELEAVALLDEAGTSLAVAEEPDAESDAPSSPQVAAVFGALARQLQEPLPPDNKDIALSEAYARVTALERDLSDRSRALSQREAELESARGELLAAQAAQKDLESRLVRAREDVASELAVLASTMIKMKEDALARSEGRAQVLAAELETMRSAALQATETAE